MKTISRTLTNGEIYQMAIDINKSFSNENTEEIYFPAAVNYCIQKNKNTLLAIAEKIEESRMSIIQHYGSIGEDGNFKIEEDNIEKANEELFDLLNVTDEIKILLINIEALGNINLSTQQMQSIMFMIEDVE